MRIPQCHAEAVHRGAEQFLFSLYRFFDQPHMTAVVNFSDFVLAGLWADKFEECEIRAKKKGSHTKLPLQKVLTGKVIVFAKSCPALRLEFAIRRRVFTVMQIALSSSEEIKKRASQFRNWHEARLRWHMKNLVRYVSVPREVGNHNTLSGRRKKQHNLRGYFLDKAWMSKWLFVLAGILGIFLHSNVWNLNNKRGKKPFRKT